jgi:hypothetical protein
MSATLLYICRDVKRNLYNCKFQAGLRINRRRIASCPRPSGRPADLFGAKFDMLLYDLTSTGFECDVPEDEQDPRRFGYSRDQRSDCVQVIVALVVTPEGLPPEGEVYVLAESGARTDKERAMRRRKLKIYWQRLHELQRQALTWDQRLEKLGGRPRPGRSRRGGSGENHRVRGRQAHLHRRPRQTADCAWARRPVSVSAAVARRETDRRFQNIPPVRKRR